MSNISRVLEKMSSGQSPADQGAGEPRGNDVYSVVFVARSGQPTAFTAHLPQMVAVASQACPDTPPIRLVGFSKACEDRLSTSLGIPRASSIALRAGAPQASSLVDFVLANVPRVQLAWLEEAKAGQHRVTSVITGQTNVGAKRQKKS